MDWKELVDVLGPAGIALVLLSCCSLYFALRNGIYLHLVGRDFKCAFHDMEARGEEYLRCLCDASSNPLVGIINGIVHTHAKHSKDIRAEVAYLFHRNFASVSQGLAYLRLISILAPLLGLLGTMLGMVDVFRELARSRASADPAMLAAGIWEALLTTIIGLSVAIPTLVVFYHLSLKVRGFRIEAVEHSYRALELCGRLCTHGGDGERAEGRDGGYDRGYDRGHDGDAARLEGHRSAGASVACPCGGREAAAGHATARPVTGHAATAGTGRMS